jgi:hypothetical protein
MKEKLFITLNSTILYVTAFLITTIIHEFSHFFIGWLNNSEPTLHHNYVEHFSTNQLSIRQHVSIALAGPVISLIQGLIAGWSYLKSRKENPGHLFLLWFSVLGFNNFFGYLMTAPLFNTGDVGKAYSILEYSLLPQIIIAIVGAIVLLIIAYKLTAPFLQFSYSLKYIANKQSRKNFSFHIIILPWIMGSGVITMLYLPIVAVISIIYPIMSGMIFIFPWQNAVTKENIKLSNNEKIGNFSFVLIALLVILIIGFKLILAPGIQF